MGLVVELSVTRRHEGRKVRFYAALSALAASALGLHKNAPLVLYCYLCNQAKQYKLTQEVQYGYIIHQCRAFYQAHFSLSSPEAVDWNWIT